MGISVRAAVLPSRARCQAAAAARKAAASRLMAVQRCQEVHVVTCPASRPATCLVSW
ncbi:MAG TPA: hypothetical protein VJ418_18475 [Streptosporangiaceae bacterium]|nr:hypothetical protein [Streptosporangiaceae bacterium]